MKKGIAAEIQLLDNKRPCGYDNEQGGRL